MVKNCDNHQFGSNPAQRSAEKTAREEVIKNREAITSWALVIIMGMIMRMINIALMMTMMIKVKTENYSHYNNCDDEY